MRTRRVAIPLCALSAVLLLLLVLLPRIADSFRIPTGRFFRGTVRAADRQPRIHPDYAGITIPPNIAPLNFAVRETGVRAICRVSGEKGTVLTVRGRGMSVLFPPRQWKRVLSEHRGSEISLEVFVRTRDGSWLRFSPVVNVVAAEEIDPYLIYRLIPPIYNTWFQMGIYQRNLEGFRETPIYAARPSVRMKGICVNCHSFPARGPSLFLFHTRGDISTTLLATPKGVSRVDMGSKMVYVCWHPDRKTVAFSTNRVRQVFHTARTEVRDVIDENSDLGVYFADTNSFATDTAIARPERLETYPCWSPDGTTLYYCSAPKLLDDINAMETDIYRKVRYDLMKIPFDPDTRSFGKPEVVLSAQETGLSILQPRVSPDGKYLLFCMCPYGCFPIYQPESDLYLMERSSGRYWKLPVNSDESDAWHCWSSNSRWIVFSSKRGTGLFARPYLCHIGADGTAGKPFVVPQRNPAFYDSYLFTYNVPELSSAPVRFRETSFNLSLESPPQKARNLSPDLLPDAGDSLPWRNAR